MTFVGALRLGRLVPVTGSVVEKVASWIAKGGIPLEYEAARALRAASFDVAQGLGYQTESDDGTKVRELDAVGRLAFGPNVAVSIVVECKHTAEHPWLVLTNRRNVALGDALLGAVASSETGIALRRTLTSETPGLMPFLITDGLPGFSVVAAFESEDPGKGNVRPGKEVRNSARDAMAQVVSGAQGVAFARQFQHDVAWPVVVIDGPLVELDYDDAGQPHLAETDRKRVLWRASPTGSTVTLDIVRSVAFPRYADEAYFALKAIGTALQADVETRATRPESHPRPLLGSDG